MDMDKFKKGPAAPRKLFEHEELPMVELESKMVDGKRYYWTPDGALYPSVTTVLSANKGDSIQKWRDRVGEKEANRISRRASDRGTELHSICEDYINNKEGYLNKRMPLCVELFKGIKPILDDNIELVYGNEIALFSHELKTAGRTDLFCRFQGMHTILDYKTSTKLKKEEWIEDYFLQATTYAMMIEEIYKDVKPIYIPQLAIVIAVEEGDIKSQLFVKKTADYREKVKDMFAAYHAKNPLPKGVLTPSLFDFID